MKDETATGQQVRSNDSLGVTPEQLRATAQAMREMGDEGYPEQIEAAADEIERLREALRPFAEHPPFHATDDWAVTQLDENAPDGKPVAGVTAGDFRRAANALGLTPNSGG